MHLCVLVPFHNLCPLARVIIMNLTKNNSFDHRIRAQKDTALPDGVPGHIYSFPDMYGLEDCGMVMSHLYMLMHFTHMYSVLPCIHHMPELHVRSL